MLVNMYRSSKGALFLCFISEIYLSLLLIILCQHIIQSVNLFWPFFTSFVLTLFHTTVCLHCVVAVSSFVYIFLGNVLYWHCCVCHHSGKCRHLLCTCAQQTIKHFTIVTKWRTFVTPKFFRFRSEICTLN